MKKYFSTALIVLSILIISVGNLSALTNAASTKVKRTLENGGRLLFDENRNVSFEDVTVGPYKPYVTLLSHYRNPAGEYVIGDIDFPFSLEKQSTKFQPDRNVNNIEFLRMLLIMNGYEIEEYKTLYEYRKNIIKKADELGLLDEQIRKNYNAPLAKGEAIRMILTIMHLYDGAKYQTKFDDVSGELANMVGFIELYNPNVLDYKVKYIIAPESYMNRQEVAKMLIEAIEMRDNIQQ